MKTRILILLTLWINSSCLGSIFPDGCWLPERYVNVLMEMPFEDHSSLIRPVHCIIVRNDSISIQTFGGEFAQVNYKKSDSRFELTNLKYLFNLNYFNEQDVLGKKYFLFTKDNYLFLQIEGQGDMESYKFVRGIGNVTFTNPQEFLFFSTLNGEYVFHNTSDKVSLLLNGAIEGSEEWDRYKLVRYSSIDFKGESFSIISLHNKTGDLRNFAIRVDKEKLLLFDFVPVGTSIYKIQTSEKPVITLNRIKN